MSPAPLTAAHYGPRAWGRLGALAAVMAAGYLALGAELWRKQVAHGAQYRESLARQSVRRIRQPALRGRIYDRRGALLADNRPSYDLALYLEELRMPGRWSNTLARVERTLAEVERRIGVPRAITAEDVRNHIRRRLPLPLVAWRDLDEAALARWAEQAAGLPGVELHAQPARVYPAGAAAAHVVGYLGRADLPADPDEPFDFDLPEYVGRAGVERRYDDRLRGAPGGRLIRVDASGFRHADLGGRPPRPGEDLQLTLDLELQRALERLFTGHHGAAVVLDARDGAVLALYSAPSFDPNALTPTISPERWRALSEDPDHPLFNRATGGAYPPGSTFKPIVGVAAQRAGLSPRQKFSCAGSIELGGHVFNCWERAGHGPLDLTGAIRTSCNVWFYRAALQVGPEPILGAASEAGLGRRSGIDLDAESPGFLPSEAWKRRVLRESWRDGDTCNLAIGQGALTVTPLQMAVVAAALANGGRLVRPHLLYGTRPYGADHFAAVTAEPPRELGWSPAALAPIREGMRQVVMSEQGTGRRARTPLVEAAGKTGTAEYGPRDARRKRGWMIAFAPYDAPRFAIAVVVDEALSGGLTAAPLMHDVLEALFAPGADDGGSG